VIRLKKPILISFIILCLLFTLLLTGHKISAKVNPNIIHVPTDYPTIQDAINHATSGDTIFVHKETYYENVVINKSISLIGEDRNLTIIDGGGTGNVIHLESGDVYISGFTIQNGGKGLYDSGIFIDHASDNNNISHNTIANSSNGICLSYSLRSTIFDNTVSNCKYGISLYSSNNNEIYGNNALDNKYGIALYSSNNNRIYGNNASSNMINGIYIHLSSNNQISSNIASLNGYDGISLDFSDNNVISDNMASRSDYGIRLSSSSNNLISGNTATYNYYGIYVHSSSDNNTIYHNNFNNTDQVWSDSLNIWNDANEGNYWSDYTGQDKNGDGIGDTPYVINVENQDNNPLMGKFSDFSVTWKDKTHHITTICNSTISNLEFEIGRETGNKIISFQVTGKDGTIGFCRVMIPTELMNYSYIVLIDEEEIIPALLDVSNKTHVYLYFVYTHSNHTVAIISSKTLYLYNEILDKYVKLQADFYNLNLTYYRFLVNYTHLLESYGMLNASYVQHLLDYAKLQENYDTLLNNYSQLLRSFTILNASYVQHLLDYAKLQDSNAALLLEHAQNIRNISYVFIVTTTFFIIVAFYLSTHAHRKDFKS
jgi:parallel beta-helix repeat protein